MVFAFKLKSTFEVKESVRDLIDASDEVEKSEVRFARVVVALSQTSVADVVLAAHSVFAIAIAKLFNDSCKVLFTRVELPTFAKKFVLMMLRFVLVKLSSTLIFNSCNPFVSIGIKPI